MMGKGAGTLKRRGGCDPLTNYVYPWAIFIGNICLINRMGPVFMPFLIYQSATLIKNQ